MRDKYKDTDMTVREKWEDLGLLEKIEEERRDEIANNLEKLFILLLHTEIYDFDKKEDFYDFDLDIFIIAARVMKFLNGIEFEADTFMHNFKSVNRQLKECFIPREEKDIFKMYDIELLIIFADLLIARYVRDNVEDENLDDYY